MSVMLCAMSIYFYPSFPQIGSLALWRVERVQGMLQVL